MKLGNLAIGCLVIVSLTFCGREDGTHPISSAGNQFAFDLEASIDDFSLTRSEGLTQYQSSAMGFTPCTPAPQQNPGSANCGNLSALDCSKKSVYVATSCKCVGDCILPGGPNGGGMAQCSGGGAGNACTATMPALAPSACAAFCRTKPQPPKPGGPKPPIVTPPGGPKPSPKPTPRPTPRPTPKPPIRGKGLSMSFDSFE